MVYDRYRVRYSGGNAVHTAGSGMESDATTTTIARVTPGATRRPRPAARASMGAAHLRRAARLPVRGSLLPRESRATLAALAAFHRETRVRGRAADSPEGQARLDAWERDVRCLDTRNTPDAPLHPVLAPLAAAHLPIAPLLDLIRAQRVRATVAHFATYDALLTYCALAANPLGRLALAVLDCTDAGGHDSADALCTALFLTRLWRDIPRDYARGRIYLPEEDMHLFGVMPDDLAEAAAHKEANTNLRALVAFETERTKMLLESGSILAAELPRRVRLDCALLVADGQAMLAAIMRGGFDPFAARPTLTRLDRAGRVVGAVRFLGSLRLSGD